MTNLDKGRVHTFSRELFYHFKTTEMIQLCRVQSLSFIHKNTLFYFYFMNETLICVIE